MPTYDYQCQDCDLVFEVVATIRQKQAGLSPRCPRCGSVETLQAFRSLTFLRGGSGPDSTPLGCGPGCGPGAC